MARTRKDLLKADLVNNPATREELAKAFLTLNEGSRKIHGRSSNTNSHQRNVDIDLAMDARGTRKAPIKANTPYDAELQKMWLRRTNEYDIVGIDEPVANVPKRITELEGWAKTPMTSPTQVTKKKTISTAPTTQPVGTRIIEPKPEEDLSDPELIGSTQDAIEEETSNIVSMADEIPDDVPQKMMYGYDEFNGSGLTNTDQESAMVEFIDQMHEGVDGDKDMLFDMLQGQSIETPQGDVLEVTKQRIQMALKVIDKHGSFAKEMTEQIDEAWNAHASVTQKSLDKSTRGL